MIKRDFLLAAALLVGLPAGMAQTHETTLGEYVLRSSSVLSLRINAETARLHGIEPAADRAVLNVVVLETGPAQKTASAEVSARRRNLAGMQESIPLREVRDGGRVSYVGSYTFLPNEVLRFQIQAVPAGHQGSPLTLEYEDRMGDIAR